MGLLMAEHLGSQEMWQAFFCRLRVAIPPLIHQHPSHHHIPVMHPKSIARACGAALSLAEKHQRELRSLCLRGHTSELEWEAPGRASQAGGLGVGVGCLGEFKLGQQGRGKEC